MTINDALRAIAGFFVLASVALGYFVHPAFFLFTAFVGANLLQSGFTKRCPMMLDPQEGRAEGRACPSPRRPAAPGRPREHRGLVPRRGRRRGRPGRPPGADRPAAARGGTTPPPAPFELFLASIATCMGYYALRFCQERGIATEGLGLSLETVRDEEKKRLGDDRGRAHAPSRLSGEIPGRDPARRRPVRGQEAHGRAAGVRADGPLDAGQPAPKRPQESARSTASVTPT